VDLRDRRAVRRRDSVEGACFTHDAVDLDRPASGLRWRWRVERNWKLIVPAVWNEPSAAVELYDVENDPFEQVNLASRQPGTVRRMRRAMDRWWNPE
jgi:uncharacterized sulfatase